MQPTPPPKPPSPPVLASLTGRVLLGCAVLLIGALLIVLVVHALA